MKKNGFTLVEMLVVVAMVGVLTAIVGGQIDWRRSKQDAAIHSLTFTLGAAQRKAALIQHNVVVAFDQSNNRIRIHNDANNDLQLDDGEGIRYVELDEGVRFGKGSAGNLPAIGGGPFEFAHTQDGLPALIFYRNGSASAYGGFYLTTAGVSDGTRARAMVVTRATGELRCYSYRTGSWEESC
jgi:prepilin-type N-terminal cleavage/methylation domain-containing protein